MSGLDFSMDFSGDLLPGSTSTLTYTLRNDSPTNNIALTFFTHNLAASIPSLAVVGAPTTDTCGGSPSGTSFITYVGGSLNVGESCTIEFDLAIPAGASLGSYAVTTSSISYNENGAVVGQPARAILTLENPITVSKAFSADAILDSGALNCNLYLFE